MATSNEEMDSIIHEEFLNWLKENKVNQRQCVQHQPAFYYLINENTGKMLCKQCENFSPSSCVDLQNFCNE